MSATDPPQYPNAPLAIVAFEVRFPEWAEVAGQQMRARLRAALRDLLPLVENITQQQVSVSLGAPLPASVERRLLPRFVTRDRTTALVVDENLLVVETTRYAGFASFRPIIETAVTALAELGPPDAVSRVGLRYIDEVRIPSVTESPGDWRGYIDDHLLATVDPDFLAGRVTPQGWQGLVQYGIGKDSALVLRYGPGDGYAVEPRGPTRRKEPPRPGPFFLLDWDSSWSPSDEVPEFDPAAILVICDQLHGPVRAMFTAACTQKLREEVFNMDRRDGV